MSKLQKYADKAKRTLKYRVILGADKVILHEDKDVCEFLVYVEEKFARQCQELIASDRDPITQIKVHEEVTNLMLKDLKERTNIDALVLKEKQRIFRCTVKIRDVQIQRPIR